jgi:dUTP pyrophosphatase
MNDLEKLNELTPKKLLAEKADEINDIFEKSGIQDWVYEEGDNLVKLNVRFVNKSNNKNPSYQKSGDSGFDLAASINGDEQIIISPMKRALIKTDLFFKIPEGFELQVRSRSGLALKNGIMVLNSPGTVDSGYIGNVGVILFNTGDEPFIVKNGDRIAQGVIAPVQSLRTIKLAQVDSLEKTERGGDGFGSTGV